MVNATEVFVVGGGPAGLAAAIAARQRGFDVVVADGARPPVDKACGEGLMPDGRAALKQLGVEIASEDSHTFRGIRFVSGGLSVEASFPHSAGLGVRRTVLHKILIQRAEEAGIHLLWQTPVSGMRPEGVQLGRNFVRSRWIVGADGCHSRVRRWAGLDRYQCEPLRFAFRRHYRISPWSDCMELHWGPKCQIYVTPVGTDEVCVALISRNPNLRLDAALPFFPELLSHLENAESASVERGGVTCTRRLGRVYNRNVALVGDASGTVDAITGEGLCLSFQQAEVLADCFAAGSLNRYQKTHRRLFRRPALMACLMLTLDWKTSFRQRALRAFGSDPRIFARMLAMHVGALSPIAFTGDGLSLGWRMLNA